MWKNVSSIYFSGKGTIVNHLWEVVIIAILIASHSPEAIRKSSSDPRAAEPEL